jgi:hypothetical protein
MEQIRIDLTKPFWSYVFAFFQADGHLRQGTRRRGRLSVEIQLRDKPMLEAIQKGISCNSSIYMRTRDTNYKKDYTSCCLNIYDLAFRQSLIALGLPTGRKSISIGLPSSDYLERDYWRGWVDADGSLGVTGQGWPFVGFCTKSNQIARGFRDYAFKITGRTRTLKPNKRDQVYNLLYQKEEAQTLAREMYYEGALCLPRKMDSAIALQSWVRTGSPKRKPYYRWTPEEDTIALSFPAHVAAEKLDRSEKGVLIRVWRLTQRWKNVDSQQT